MVISGNNQNFLVHPIICNNVLALALDGSSQCCFLLDSTKEELDNINSLKSIESYINKNANKIPLLSKAGGTGIRNVVIQSPIPSDAIYATDQRLKKYDVRFWNEAHTDYVYHQRLFITSLFSYKKYTGTVYSSRHNFVIEYIDGRAWRISVYHPNKQLAMELVWRSDDDDGKQHFYDENGYELSEESVEARCGDYLDRIMETEGEEFENIADGGYKDDSNSWF